MIIVGDIASPNEKCSTDLKQIFNSHAGVFGNNVIVCNFEGLVCDDILTNTNTPVLYNHSSVLDVLVAANVKAVGLANNHTLDLPSYFDSTVNALSKRKIAFTGAGRSNQECAIPAVFLDGDTSIFLFNECWDFLLYHQKNPVNGIHIATIQFSQLAKRVRECKEQNPNACIVIYLHWSLDLEILPYPMYRQFSEALIDAGASIVAGCHSHCVQGGEQYKDGYIVYGLGNFFLPNHVFANGKLHYPSFATTQLVLEYKPDTKKAFCHWFKYEEIEGQHHLLHLESAPFQTSPTLKKYSPYQQMAHTAYIHFFKKNRRKKILIPLFKDYQNANKLKMLTGLLKTRAIFARMLAKVNLIKWGS